MVACEEELACHASRQSVMSVTLCHAPYGHGWHAKKHLSREKKYETFAFDYLGEYFTLIVHKASNLYRGIWVIDSQHCPAARTTQLFTIRVCTVKLLRRSHQSPVYPAHRATARIQ